MSRIEGQPLAAVLKESGRLPYRRALRITAAICKELDIAHCVGILHYDVKPGNIILTYSGEIKVINFGVITPARSGESGNRVIGTAQYISPEQARGEPVDERSDIYSAGCVLYELLTGRPPFTGDSAVMIAYQHCRKDPVPPSELVADIPNKCDTVALKSLAKSPDMRYQTALAMAEAIDAILGPVR
jgi:eukaryotic-like serine/threonine-protein kinase